MEFNKVYSRKKFLEFLRVIFLPEDFINQNEYSRVGLPKEAFRPLADERQSRALVFPLTSNR